MERHPGSTRTIAIPAVLTRLKELGAGLCIMAFPLMLLFGFVTHPNIFSFAMGDTNIPVGESIERFEALPFEVLIGVYPDGGHGITDPVSGRIQQAYLDDLVSFILGATED